MKTKYTYLNVGESLVIRVQGECQAIDATHPMHKEILAGLRDGIDEEAMMALIRPARKIVKFLTDQGYEVTSSEDTIEVAGESVEVPVIADRLLAAIRAGLPVDNLVHFLVRVRANPSYKARQAVYSYIEAHALPITPEGHFLGYKGVNPDLWSIHGNTSTKVITGKVDDQGRIWNGIGEEIRVDRGCVDDDEANGCSSGLHVGSEDYANSFGRVTVIVDVDPADVVTVPSYEIAKMRVAAYKVIAVSEGTLPPVNADPADPYATPDEDDGDDEDADDKFKVRYCPKCGSETAHDDNYCTECGHRLA